MFVGSKRYQAYSMAWDSSIEEYVLDGRRLSQEGWDSLNDFREWLVDELATGDIEDIFLVDEVTGEQKAIFDGSIAVSRNLSLA